MNGRPGLGDLPPDRWRRLEALLDATLELPPDEAARILDGECIDDPDLRARVEAVLRADRTRDGALDGSISERAPELLERAWSAAEAENAPPSGTRLGSWRLLHEIGRGGMGAVYLAERADPQFAQRVAIKLLKRGLDTDEILTRFRRERQILARLDHPNIARLIDGGAGPDGEPWLAMEYVQGEPVGEWARKPGRTLEEVLGLFDRIAEAVSYAHRNLVIHRDLKPGNILVGAGDVVKLLDFGVARVLDPDQPSSGTTLGGAHAMTPSYGAPEQVRGEPATTATDVYGLGVVLYELLTGAWPYGARPSSTTEVQRRVVETEPVPPSVVVRRDPGAGGPATPPPWSDRLRGDLDAIVVKTLRKDPAERYSSVDALRADLADYRLGNPVSAARGTRRYRLGKFARRNRGLLVASAAVLTALLAGLATTTWQSQVARLERDRARQETRRAEAMRDFVIGLFAHADPNVSGGDTLTARELLDAGVERSVRTLQDQPALLADVLGQLAEMYGRLGLYTRARETAARSLAIRRRLFGAHSPEAARGLSDLGGALAAAGDFQAADSVLREAVAIQTRGRVEPPELATTLRRLGSAEMNLGRPAAAESLLFRSLAIDRQTRSPDSREVADDLSELGNLYEDGLGDPVRALPYMRQAYDVRERVLGPSDLATVTALQNLGEVLASAGKMDSAMVVDAQVIAARRHVQGPDHPDLAFAMSNAAARFLLSSRYAAAESLFVEALRIQRQRLGPEHPETVRTENNYAYMLTTLGRYDEAERLLRHVDRAWRATLGSTHSNAVRARGNLARVLALLGRYDEARALLVDAERSAGSGPNRASLVVIETQFAALHRRMHEPAEAERRYRLALELCRTDSSLSLRAREVKLDLASLLREQDRLAEARVLGEDALASAERELERGDPRHIRPALDLAWTLALIGEPARAESLCLVSMDALARTHAPPWRARVVLAFALAGRGQSGEAGRLLEANLDSLARATAPPDSLVRDARALRARLRSGRGAT